MYTWVCLIPKSKQLGTFSCLTNDYICTQNNVPFLVCQQTQHCIHFTEVHCILLFKVEDLFGRNLLLPVDRQENVMDSQFGLLDFTSFTPCFMV